MSDLFSISFNIVGGEYKKFTNIDPAHEMVYLKVGDTVDIFHSNKNWEGKYEVTSKVDAPFSIQYNLILTRVELQNITDIHNKRWIGEVKYTDGLFNVVCEWGKIGAKLQSVTKNFLSKQEASSFLREKMNEKIIKGYKLI